MLDGLILQVVLTVVCLAAAALVLVWFTFGITKKSAAWVIKFAVPFAIIAAVILSLITA